MTWWAIATGLVVEWPVVKHLARRDWMGSLWPNLAVNAVSSILGIVLIPLGLGTFNPFGWATTVLLAAALNAAVEALALRWLFRTSVTRRGFGLLFGANMVSVGLAMASILFSPPQR